MTITTTYQQSYIDTFSPLPLPFVLLHFQTLTSSPKFFSRVLFRYKVYFLLNIHTYNSRLFYQRYRFFSILIHNSPYCRTLTCGLHFVWSTPMNREDSIFIPFVSKLLSLKGGVWGGVVMKSTISCLIPLHFV